VPDVVAETRQRDRVPDPVAETRQPAPVPGTRRPDPVPDPVTDPVAEVRQRIRGLLAALFGGGGGLAASVSDTVSLRKAGVPSAAMVSLLVRMEDTFGFEWDDDVAPEVLRSIDSLARHVVALRG
jgi:acyl carrier protein